MATPQLQLGGRPLGSEASSANHLLAKCSETRPAINRFGLPRPALSLSQGQHPRYLGIKVDDAIDISGEDRLMIATKYANQQTW